RGAEEVVFQGRQALGERDAQYGMFHNPFIWPVEGEEILAARGDNRAVLQPDEVLLQPLLLAIIQRRATDDEATSPSLARVVDGRRLGADIGLEDLNCMPVIPHLPEQVASRESALEHHSRYAIVREDVFDEDEDRLTSAGTQGDLVEDVFRRLGIPV